MGRPLLFGMIDKAVYDYKMIEKGDRILIGASGGKDSSALLEYFAGLSKRPNFDFSYKALHIYSEITPPLNPDLEAIYAKWGVDVESMYVDVLGRLKPGRKMNCWWCSTQRRTELMNYAIANGYNKIALGHHMDDILETVFMNMLYRGELSTMPPVMKYDNYPVTIIRPLCYADVSTIIEHATNCGYICSTCTCNYQDNSRRKEARRRLEQLTDGEKNKKNKIFSSLKNILPDYLP